MRETHSAHVFLTATRAFKVRKPVDLGFLDYSTLDKRRRAARTEVELCQRARLGSTDPSVHLGVWSLDTTTLELTPPPHPPSSRGEPVVAMRRLDDALRADRVMAAAGVPPSRLDGAIADCVSFHSRCPLAPEGGDRIALERAWRAHAVAFEELPEGAPDLPFDPAERQELLHGTRSMFDAIAPILLERAREGRVREGHGDLRLEHIYLSEPWSLIDPLEFSLDLRLSDVAAEIAFVAVELDALGRPDAARHALERYATLAGDASLAAVAPFFLRYRALVRAKVGWFRAQQQRGAARAETLARARAFTELALVYGRPTPRRQ